MRNVKDMLPNKNENETTWRNHPGKETVTALGSQATRLSDPEPTLRLEKNGFNGLSFTLAAIVMIYSATSYTELSILTH